MNLKYRPDIDGLRALAVISVIIFHLNPNWLRGGFIGVDVFFVISGYLITKIIYNDMKNKRFSFKTFYHRRINRILPVFFFVIFFTSIVAWFILYLDEFLFFLKSVRSTVFFWENMFFAKHIGGYFDLLSEEMPILHTWSLAVEEQFYILFPILLLCLTSIKSNNRPEGIKKTTIIAIFSIIAVISFLLSQFSYKSMFLIQYNYYSLFTARAGELLIGSIIGILSVTEQSNKVAALTEKLKSNQNSNVIFYKNIMTGVGLLMIIFSFIFISENDIFPSVLALIPTVGAALIIFCYHEKTVVTRLLSLKIFTFIGAISYSLYLWHWPIIVLTKKFLYIGRFENIEEYIAVIAMTIIASLFTYYCIEVPCRKKKKSFKFSFICFYLIPSLIILSIFTIQSKTKFLNKRSYISSPNQSSRYIVGRDDFLFIGNAFQKTIDKLTLSIKPSFSQLTEMNDTFRKIIDVADLYNTQVVLFIGPNKSSIYPEYLPDYITPSKIKYVDYYLEILNKNKHLILHDPREDLLANKNSFLYYRNGSHWNSKGAFIAFNGFLQKLNIKAPSVTFNAIPSNNNDLIYTEGVVEVKFHNDDNFQAILMNSDAVKCIETTTTMKTPFGNNMECFNSEPISNKSVWIIGDSFTSGLKQYFNTTFRKVSYIGHWEIKLHNIEQELLNAKEKPDILVIIMVERAF